uniref:Uncharacterized protein n=1 Tax=Kalanchoe fedtschenkoi TaxID=63787 RepID=A0A7N0UPI8_KALFE
MSYPFFFFQFLSLTFLLKYHKTQKPKLTQTIRQLYIIHSVSELQTRTIKQSLSTKAHTM